MTSTPSASTAPLLEVRDLAVVFDTEEGPARAVDGVSFSVRAGETLAIVGESGCGKSVTALALLGLVPKPARVSGEVYFEGRDLLRASGEQLRAVRGDGIAMVFQEPMTALNPVFTVGEQIAETVRTHRGASKQAARARAIEVMRDVGIPAPETRADAYPHQLSGGMRQRVLIALAICCEPRVLIADEPTTALDVTVQAQILALLGELKERLGMGVLFITHDLGVVAETADRVLVLYGGEVVEEADVITLFDAPRHPYTRGLFDSRPDLARRGQRLHAIPGVVPPATAWPSGCRFRTRCEHADARCAEEAPVLRAGASGSSQRFACHHVERIGSADGVNEERRG